MLTLSSDDAIWPIADVTDQLSDNISHSYILTTCQFGCIKGICVMNPDDVRELYTYDMYTSLFEFVYLWSFNSLLRYLT